MIYSLSKVPMGHVLVLGLSVISSFQTTKVLAAPIPSYNRTLGGSFPNSGNNSFVARDSSDSNNTVSNSYPRKPPTEEFCHTSADCDYGYKCDHSGKCAWGCDENADCNHHSRHQCVKKFGECMTVKYSFWGDTAYVCREFDRGCFWTYQCCSGLCERYKCARRPRY